MKLRPKKLWGKGKDQNGCEMGMGKGRTINRRLSIVFQGKVW